MMLLPCVPRALLFSVWNSAAVSSRRRSNSSHLVPISAALFSSGESAWNTVLFTTRPP